MRVAAFPKCYIDEISHGQMSLFEWIEQAQTLDVDGLELYERFLPSTDVTFLDQVGDALQRHGFEMPMLCCSPDFTHPDAGERQRAVDREMEMIAVARHLGGPGVTCRVLSGQRHPGVTDEQGIAWVLEALDRLLPVARQHDVVLAMENHYKDGNWRYPEFAQRPEIFRHIVDAVQDRDHFGVQFDPSNAIVAGADPVDFLRTVADRIVSMQASDRYLEEGHSLAEMREADGTLGYSPHLKHGVVGRGLNDYDEIFRILRAVGYDGWISIEDGLNGLEEMAESVRFLRAKISQYPAPPEGASDFVSAAAPTALADGEDRS